MSKKQKKTKPDSNQDGVINRSEASGAAGSGKSSLNGNDKKKPGKTKIFYISAALIIIIAAAIIWGVGADGIKNIFKDPETETTVTDENMPEAKVKLYIPTDRVVAPENLSSANLLISDNSFSPNSGAAAMYDGSEATASGGTCEWAVLDAGELKTLTGIRYLPNSASQEYANSCVGAKFLASKDNQTYYELGEVKADVNGNLNLDWHNIDLSGFGLYRYFRVELPPNASFSEVEWLCSDGIVISGNPERSSETNPGAAASNAVSGAAYNISANILAFDALENFSGYAVYSIYDRSGKLKYISAGLCDVRVGEYLNLGFSAAGISVGDTVKVHFYDAATGAAAIDAPLSYSYTEASSVFEMSNIFSDNMMFQADSDLKVWGKAPLGSVVDVLIENTETGERYAASDTAENVSDWEVNLGAFENGGAYRMEIYLDRNGLDYDEAEPIETFENITFGDIWIFAGQSNMEYYLCGEDAGVELMESSRGQRQADNPNLRIVNLWNIGLMGANGETEDLPLNDWNEYWAPMTPDRVNYLSAIAYYFSQRLYETTGRNIGIISVAAGDTEINQWYPYGKTNGTFTGDSGKLYNNRIYPFTRMAVKGVLWYQGEADQYRTNMTAEQYGDAMAGLVNEYRAAWNDDDLPFYWAQLVRYSVKDETYIREGQRLALEKVANTANTGMISLIDIIGRYENETGCARYDIHPWQKETAANRFANMVLHDIYGYDNIDRSGPVYSGMEADGSRLILTFDCKGSLRLLPKESYADEIGMEYLESNEIDVQKPQEFWIMDQNGEYYRAEAEIDGNTVIVWNDDVQNPQGVLYAWGAYPEAPNLTDESGLPCSTFSAYLNAQTAVSPLGDPVL